jgi:hypothetical protein
MSKQTFANAKLISSFGSKAPPSALRAPSPARQGKDVSAVFQCAIPALQSRGTWRQPEEVCR